LGEAIDYMLRRNGLTEGVNQVKIASIWDNQMGPMIARSTTELRLYNGVLTIAVNSAPLVHELSMGKEMIRRNLNEALGEEVVVDVRVKQGSK